LSPTLSRPWRRARLPNLDGGRSLRPLGVGQREQSSETVTFGVGGTLNTLMSSSSLITNGWLGTGWLRTPMTEHSARGALPIRLILTSAPEARSWLMVVNAPPDWSGAACAGAVKANSAPIGRMLAAMNFFMMDLPALVWHCRDHGEIN